MLSLEFIKKLVNQHLEGTDKFIVDIKLTSDNRIFVYLDADENLTVSDCINVHRHIESQLDRDTENFELLVSSAGLDKGFKIKRQYLKNVGRDVQVTTNDTIKTIGKLIAVDDSGIELEKLPEKKNKKKTTNQDIENIKILFEDIKETKAVISFKK